MTVRRDTPPESRAPRSGKAAALLAPGDPASLPDAFRSLAVRQPDVAAILAPDRAPLPFGAFWRRLEATRDELHHCGVGRGDLVAIALPNGSEMAVCLMATACAAIAVPLNPDHAEDEFARYLARIRPKAIILRAGGGAAARGAAAAQGIAVIDLEPQPGSAAGSFSLRSVASGTPERGDWNGAEDVGVILLTSGSTGRVKLVPLKNDRLVAYAVASRGYYRLAPSDRCVHVMPMFHGHGVQSSLIAPLVSGGGVVCLGRFGLPDFFDAVARFRPTWYTAGYTIHQTILDGIEPYRGQAKAAGLRFIRSGSGRLDPRVMHGLEEAFGAPVVERYGMTETGILTYNPLPPAERRAGTVGILGANEVRIRGGNGAFLEPGREGEIVARGPTVVNGYWDDPEATAEAFVDGWFRTGDLGRFDADGFLTITGRIKDVINRGGEKISPIEVEQVIARHPSIAAVCVFPVPHPTLGQELAAAAVARPGCAAEEAELLAFARAHLAPFKVPRRVFLCASLPKGNSGKVHRATVAQMCLAMMAQAGTAGGAQTARPPTELERQILEMWNAVLGSDSTDIDQDFFLAGGDSLTAAELFTLIRKRLGVTLGLGQIFDEATTVSGIARLVEQARSGVKPRRDLPPGLIPIKPDGDLPPVFAVPGNGGNPLGFVHLGRLLDRRQPFYGIESVGFDGAALPFDRMEDIAANNVQRIRALQPGGPYYLAGACFGARVAYEMARQLDAAGERVALIVMLDPSPPFTNAEGRPRGQRAERGGRSGRFRTARFVLDRVKLHARTIASLRGEDRRAYIRQRVALVADIVHQRDLFRGDRSELYERSVVEANLRAGRAYIPGPYAGPTVLCFTRDRPLRLDRDYRLDWLQLVPQCGEPIYIDGHDSLSMTNLVNAPALAERLDGWLRAARTAEVGRDLPASIRSAAQ